MNKKKEEMSKGYEIYEVYLQGHEKDVNEGNPFEMEIRDRATFNRIVVKAKVARSKNDLPSGEDLWIRSYDKDEVKEEPWVIKIVEVLDDDYIVPRPDEGKVGKETFKVY
jgi:hypothetical protein